MMSWGKAPNPKGFENWGGNSAYLSKNAEQNPFSVKGVHPRKFGGFNSRISHYISPSLI